MRIVPNNLVHHNHHYISILLKIKLNQQSGGLWKEFNRFIKKSVTGSIFIIDSLTFIINRDEIIAIDHYQNLSKPKKMRLCHNLFWYTGQFKTRKQKTLKIWLNTLKNKKGA